MDLKNEVSDAALRTDVLEAIQTIGNKVYIEPTDRGTKYRIEMIMNAVSELVSMADSELKDNALNYIAAQSRRALWRYKQKLLDEALENDTQKDPAKN